MRELDQISTTELIDELSDRCAPMIFIGTKQEDGGVPSVFWRWQGHDASCYALCHQMSYYIQKNMVYFETLDAIEGNAGNDD